MLNRRLLTLDRAQVLADARSVAARVREAVGR
jgi:hypothetical protein